MTRRIFISGHRGTRIHEIENTRAAFEYCLKNALDYIEFDVKRTLDNEIVVFHDAKINRLMNGTGLVEQLTLSQLKKYSYHDGQKIQTLSEFFMQVGKKIRPMLEIKSRGIGPQIMDLIHEFDYSQEEILIQSFFGKDIEECYRIDSEYDYGLCLSVLGKFPIFKRQIASKFVKKFIKPYPVKWLNLDGPFIYEEIIQEVDKLKLKIILGAKNTEKYLPNMDKWKVGIVNADDPTKIRNLIQNLGYETGK